MSGEPSSPPPSSPATDAVSSRLQRFGPLLFTPLLAWGVGVVALPQPRGIDAEQAAFDRSGLTDVIRDQVTPRHPVRATLGDVDILGADLPDHALSRGARATFTVYFSPRAPLDRDWQVFVHIDAKDGRSRLNGDHYPAGGRYRTTLWRAGEVIADRFERVITPNLPAGDYDVWVGFYRGDDRLPFRGGDRSVTDGDNRVRVGTIVVE